MNSVIGQNTPTIENISDKELMALIKEAESRGLSEEQIETLALARGYSQSDIQIIKDRINQIKSGVTSQKIGSNNESSNNECLPSNS